MSTSSPSPFRPERPAEACAEVHARDRVIRYRRSGAGRAVVVVSDAPPAHPFWSELRRAVERDFRLIVPDAPAGDVDLTCWLSDFLDGLGLSRVVVIVGDRFCVPALEVALADLHRLARLVLLPAGDGESAPGADRALLSGPEQRVHVPLLVIRSGRPAHEALPLIAGFLAGAGDGAPS